MAKKLNPQEQQRVQQRKTFVQANPDLDPAVARQRFFVQTRVQELTKSGIDVTKERRAALREQFSSGDISRKGFLTPGDVKRSNNNREPKPDPVIVPPKLPGGVGAAAARAKGMVNTSTTVFTNSQSSAVVPSATRTTTSSATPSSTGTSTTTSSATPQKKQNPFNNPVTRFIGKTVLDTGDSINATFVNPAANLIGKAFGKNPRLREAGPLEAGITTADAILTAASAGGYKPVSTVVRKGVETLASSLANKSLFRTSTAVNNIADRAFLRPGVFRPVVQTELKNEAGEFVTKRGQQVFRNATPDETTRFFKLKEVADAYRKEEVYAEAFEASSRNPTRSPSQTPKPITKPSKTKPPKVTEVVGEKTVPKPAGEKTKAPTVESVDPVVGKSDKDLAPYSDIVRKGPMEMSSTQVPKTKSTPDVVQDVTPAVGSSKRVEWVRPKSTTPDVVLKADQVIPTYETPYTQKFAPRDPNWTPNDLRTTKGETEIKNTASFRDPKASQIKYTASKKNKQLSRPIETTSKIVNEMPANPKTITKAPVETHARAGMEYPITTKFGSQQGYDNWLATGGKERLKRLAGTDPNGLVKFQQQNVKFLRSREAAKEAAKELTNKTQVDAAKKVIAHEQAIKAGTPELSPAVQEAAKLKAAEVPTAPKAKTEPAPAKKPVAKKSTKAKKAPAKKKSGNKKTAPKGGLEETFNRITMRGL